MQSTQTINENDSMDDIELDHGRETVVASCETILGLGAFAAIEGAVVSDCPFPVMSMGAMLWLSGLTGCAIANAGSA